MERPLVSAFLAELTLMVTGAVAFAGEVNGKRDPDPISDFHPGLACNPTFGEPEF